MNINIFAISAIKFLRGCLQTLFEIFELDAMVAKPVSKAVIVSC